MRWKDPSTRRNDHEWAVWKSSDWHSNMFWERSHTSHVGLEVSRIATAWLQTGQEMQVCRCVGWKKAPVCFYQCGASRRQTDPFSKSSSLLWGQPSFAAAPNNACNVQNKFISLVVAHILPVMCRHFGSFFVGLWIATTWESSFRVVDKCTNIIMIIIIIIIIAIIIIIIIIHHHHHHHKVSPHLFATSRLCCLFLCRAARTCIKEIIQRMTLS